jgi:hypothetical protein
MNQGESAREDAPPFDPSPSSDSSGEPDTLSDALEEIFPGFASQWRTLQPLCALAMNFGSKPDDIRRWPRWLANRHPGKIPNPLVFRDTFPAMTRETNERSVAYEFVYYACGHRQGAQLGARASDEIAREAKFIEAQVGSTVKDDWKRRNLMPQYFRRFWGESLAYPGFATPEKVRTYWPQFVEWVAAWNGLLAKPPP